MAAMAAFWMLRGVGKSGCPMQNETMSLPDRASALTSASTTNAFSVPSDSARRDSLGTARLVMSRFLSLAVQVAECAARRCGHVAAHAPLLAEGEPMDGTVAAGHATQHAHTDPARERIQRGPQRNPRPCLECRALAPGPHVLAELALAQLALQVGQRDLDRAHDAA